MAELRLRLSYLGSLAHPYQMCIQYETCLEKHMAIVNRQRNVEAAHSSVMEFNPTGCQVERRADVTQDVERLESTEADGKRHNSEGKV
jgi:hypothetical protein